MMDKVKVKVVTSSVLRSLAKIEQIEQVEIRFTIQLHWKSIEIVVRILFAIGAVLCRTAASIVAKTE